MNKPTGDRPSLTQAMIDAYDEYTHLTLDRRRFMRKLTRLAGSGAAAAALVPLLAADAARAAIVPADDQRVAAEELTYPGAERTEMKGYLARPSGQNSGLPAVIVIHENRGLNDHIRDIARRLAVEGFLALAPDYLSAAGGTPADEDDARRMIAELDRRQVTDNSIAAIAFLQAHEFANGNVGAVGFCWGGGAVNDLAVAATSLDAGVAYYGRQADTEAVDRIAAPLLLHYAGEDARSTPASRLIVPRWRRRASASRSMSTRASSTPSTTTPPSPATMRPRHGLPGSVRWRSSSAS